MKGLNTILLSLLALAGVCSCVTTEAPGRGLQSDGREIHYEVYGDSPKTIFFIHGWTGNSSVWKYQLRAFPGYTTIAVDLPGNGRSSKDEKASYSMEAMADAVAAVAQQEKVTKAFFFGHSMGFAVVEVLAAKYPGLCAGIGSIDGTHFTLPADPAARDQWVRYNRQFAEAVATEQGRSDFLNALWLPDTPRLLKEEVMAESRRVPLPIGKAMIEGVVTDQKYWADKTVALPCLAVYGPAYHLSQEDKARFMKTFPLAEYHEVTGVSHFFMLEIPYVVNQLIADFLEKNYR
jgi:pimeloyl-ACP methyl ester carboxylesterase